MSGTQGRYEMLIECYLSGQMTEKQFAGHCEADEVFSAFASKRLAEAWGRRLR